MLERELAVAGSVLGHAGPVPRVRRRRRSQPVVAAGAPHQRADQRRVRRESRLRARRGGRAARRGHHRSRRQGDRARSPISSRSSASCTTASARRCASSRIDDPNTAQVARDAHGSPLVPGPRVQARRRERHLAVQRLGGRRRRRSRSKPATTSYAKTADPIVNKLAPSLVLVNFDMPYSVSGITERSYYGTGVILDAERGLVLVDRNTVPSPLGDVRLTFAGTIEIPGRVEYVHPLHNLAIVSYDPALIGTTPAHAATLRADRAAAGRAGVGGRACAPTARCNRARRPSRRSIRSAFPLSRTLQFRDANLETDRADQRPERLRRRAGQQERRGGRELGELRVRSGPRDRAGESRHSRGPAAGDAAAGARRARAAFAGGGAAAGAARERPQARPDRTRGCSAWSSTARSAGRCSSVQRLVGGSPATQLLQVGRPDPRHRRRRS